MSKLVNSNGTALINYWIEYFGLPKKNWFCITGLCKMLPHEKIPYQCLPRGSWVINVFVSIRIKTK